MKLESVSAIVETLNAAKVRYLVVGGLAVVARPAEFRSQVLKKTGSRGSTAALCDGAWKVALSAALCVKAFDPALRDCHGH